MDYLGSLSLQSDAALVLTDSGGIQEEATCLSVPCLTLRENTERPITVTEGTSTLVGNDEAAIREAFTQVVDVDGQLVRQLPHGTSPDEIVRVVREMLGS